MGGKAGTDKYCWCKRALRAHTASFILEGIQQMLRIDLDEGLLEALDGARDFCSRDIYLYFSSAWLLLGSFAIDDVPEDFEP